MSDIKVGIGQVDYSPPTGLPMGGHMRYAAGVNDPLCSRALVLEGEGGAKIALVGVDILMLDRGHVAFMRRYIERECGIPPEHVLIAASHTHSGPAAVPLYGMVTAADRDIEAFLTQAGMNRLVYAPHTPLAHEPDDLVGIVQHPPYERVLAHYFLSCLRLIR